MKRSLLTLVAFVFAMNVHAQDGSKAYSDDYSKWSISLNGGNLAVWGDLKSFNGFQESNVDYDVATGGFELGGSFMVTRMFNPFFGIRGQALYGSISGTNGARHFESDIFDWSFDAVFNPFTAFNMGKSNRDRKWSLLMTAGVGLSSTAADVYLNNTLDYSVPANEDRWGTRHRTLFVPIGLQLKRKINKSLDLDLGSQFRYHFSDFIDGFESGRGNDVTYYTYVGLTYNFGGKKAKHGSMVYASPLSDMFAVVADAEEKMDKLTKDSDGDGVPDYFDKDPETPEGVAVDGAGRPLDVDMDGIPDYMDEDPFTAKGAKVDSQGRELDSDGDGVPDSKDLEPNTPKGSLVDVRGRAIPSGGAGGEAAFPQAYFAFNSATVTASNQERLAVIANVLKHNKDVNLILIGHTDKVGSEEYNKKLGERRAKAVKDYLVKNFGVDESRLTIQSAGKGDPLGNLNNINRRVEFRIK